MCRQNILRNLPFIPCIGACIVILSSLVFLSLCLEIEKELRVLVGLFTVYCILIAFCAVTIIWVLLLFLFSFHTKGSLRNKDHHSPFVRRLILLNGLTGIVTWAILCGWAVVFGFHAFFYLLLQLAIGACPPVPSANFVVCMTTRDLTFTVNRYTPFRMHVNASDTNFMRGRVCGETVRHVCELAPNLIIDVVVMVVALAGNLNGLLVLFASFAANNAHMRHWLAAVIRRESEYIKLENN